MAAAALFLLAAVSCLDEKAMPVSGLTGGEGWATLRFGASANEVVVTRSTQGHVDENKLYNIFVFIFDGNGNKIYSKYFDSETLKASQAEVVSETRECWFVDEADATGETTTGCVRILAPAGTGFKAYVIANIDADMVQISSDLLSNRIDREQDLIDFTVKLNQETVYRNGYFPMCGKADGVTISEGLNDNITEKTAPLWITRLDAKVRFIFKAGSRPDENGQKIKSFTPDQWKVVSVPKTTRLYMQGTDSGNVPAGAASDSYKDYAAQYFDTPWANFEDFNVDGSTGFSFYMLENRLTPKNSGITSYHDRSRQVKEADGTNRKQSVTYQNMEGQEVTKDMCVFENANDFSTYVLVTGKVTMDLVNDDAGQVLEANVQYLIHLGDWDAVIDNSEGSHWDDDQYGGVSDFNTNRNTSYTYTVTVNSVNNIRVEVEGNGTENQPGASGQVTIAKEEIALCDAHYTTKTLTFKASNFFEGTTGTAEELTWSVKTPFCDGSPIQSEGGDIPANLDYEWVHFRLNKRDANGHYYSDKRRKYTPRVYEAKTTWQSASDNKEGDGTDGLAGYHNDGCMDIIAMVKYIKEQVKLYETFLKYGGTNVSDFDDDDLSKAKISVTVFVDEFYYDRHPITGVQSTTLWKHFVNQQDRKMHILCNSNASPDLESRTTGSVITIQQQSIQSIYNTNPDYTELNTAWGTEHIDEYEFDPSTGELSQWVYSKNTTTNTDRGNTDALNGRLNSAKAWELCDANSKTFKTGKKWSEYMDYEVENTVPLLNDDNKDLRHACMARNRDNDGDGEIDQDEIRWYLASPRQLNGLYMGDAVLSSTAKLYNRSAADKASDENGKWRQHIVSSMRYMADDSNNPVTFWGEEGIAVSSWEESKAWVHVTSWSVRCVRDLGVDPSEPLDVIPDDIATVDVANRIITATHLNEACLRYYTSKDLAFHHESMTENMLYKRFEVMDHDIALNGTTGLFFQDVADIINESTSTSVICPDGWRTPNQREVAMMGQYLGVTESMTRTAFSMGYYADNIFGLKQHEPGKYGFSIYDGKVSLMNSGTPTRYVRCVRDVRMD